MSIFSLSDVKSLRFLLRKVLASKGKRSWVRLVDTQSMSPTLSGNVFLLVEWTEEPDYQLGDLILFPSEPTDLLVVHRVCGLKTTESGGQILQIADRLLIGGKMGGGWLPIEVILGRIVSIRWGEPGTKATNIESRLHCFVGKLIAVLSARRWEHVKHLSKRRIGSISPLFGWKTLDWLTFSALHRLMCYGYSIFLRVTAIALQENNVEEL